MYLGSESALKQREACQLFLARAWAHVESQFHCVEFSFMPKTTPVRKGGSLFGASGLADFVSTIAAGGSGKACKPR